MKVKEVIKLLESKGWYLVKIKGSHRQFKHIEIKGRVTIAGKLSDDLHPKTLSSIYKQAKIK